MLVWEIKLTLMNVHLKKKISFAQNGLPNKMDVQEMDQHKFALTGTKL